MKSIVMITIMLLTFMAHAIGVPVATVRNAYTTTPVTTSAYVTIIAALTSSVVHANLADSSGQVMYLSWAATCGGLVSTANTIIVPASSKDLAGFDLRIPSGYCVGLKAISANATTGEFDLNLFY